MRDHATYPSTYLYCTTHWRKVKHVLFTIVKFATPMGIIELRAPHAQVTYLCDVIGIEWNVSKTGPRILVIAVQVRTTEKTWPAVFAEPIKLFEEKIETVPSHWRQFEHNFLAPAPCHATQWSRRWMGHLECTHYIVLQCTVGLDSWGRWRSPHTFTVATT